APRVRCVRNREPGGLRPSETHLSRWTRLLDSKTSGRPSRLAPADASAGARVHAGRTFVAREEAQQIIPTAGSKEPFGAKNGARRRSAGNLRGDRAGQLPLVLLVVEKARLRVAETTLRRVAGADLRHADAVVLSAVE